MLCYFIIFPQRKENKEKVKIEKSFETSSEQLQIIDLNSADSILLISINGVGPFYSKQILEYRKKLGGFISYTQFSEIWGFQTIQPQEKQILNTGTFRERRATSASLVDGFSWLC